MRRWLRWLGLWCVLVISALGIAADMYIVSYYGEAPVGLALLAAVLFVVSAVVAACILTPSWFKPEVHAFFVRAFLLMHITLILGVVLTVSTAVLAGVAAC